MSVVIVTGSTGLVGSETVKYYCEQGWNVVGIDNNMRMELFGPDSSTEWMRRILEKRFVNYTHNEIDIRNRAEINSLFTRYEKNIELVVHTAAQPSHDWAAKDPEKDFSINAYGTIVLLEAVRKHCPEAVFVFTSTNKVYGDTPNKLPLIERDTRYELDPAHRYYDGIDETMSIDNSMHSLFGASKVAADVMVQEYGKYFGLKTGVFRGGCLTGPAHSGTKLHGFLSYLVRCVITGTQYTIYGYKGKQVRDNIHSTDLISAFDNFFRAPRPGETYNMGGGRRCNISMVEAIDLCQEVAGKELNVDYVAENRAGDHIWWISGLGKFKSHYPDWKQVHDNNSIIKEIYEAQEALLKSSTRPSKGAARHTIVEPRV